MSTLAKIKTKKDKKISKKGLSAMIGYVLLVVFATVVGVIVYKWQASYVPQDEYAACPGEASLFVDNINYDCANNVLTFDIRNNGQFAIGGYFIYVKDSAEKTIATLEISNNNTDNPDPRLYNSLNINAIKLGLTPADTIPDTNNDFLPGATESERYTMVGIAQPIYGIEIVPIRWQEEGRKTVLASCKEVKISEDIAGCDTGTSCVPQPLSEICGDRECGTILNNCYDEVSCGDGCDIGDFCDSTGHCVTPENCEYTCENLGFVCGYHVICGEPTYCGDATPDEDGCPDGYTCDDFSGHCILDDFTCNGFWEGSAESPGIECDVPEDPNCNDFCYCDAGYEPTGNGWCEVSGSGIPESCQAVCEDVGYTGLPQAGACQQNQAQANLYCNLNGVYESSGDVWCDDPPQIYCYCCT